MDSQTPAADVEKKAAGTDPAPAPAGPSTTPQLPQQSLVDKLNEVAEAPPVLPKAVGTENGSIAFVTTPGLAEGIQTTADAVGANSPAGSPRVKGNGNVRASPAQQAEKSVGKTRASRAAKQAASAKIASSAAAVSSGKRASSASRPSAEMSQLSGGTAAASNKENEQSAPPTVGGQEASHMAVKEPHSRVEGSQGAIGSTPGEAPSSSKKKKKAVADKRDPLIGRCVKKDFETESGVKNYTGWVIGKHPKKNWYTVPADHY